MSVVVETLLRLFFVHIVYPIVMEVVLKREVDPAFKAASDAAYDELKNAQTTAARMAAARKLHDLNKKS